MIPKLSPEQALAPAVAEFCELLQQAGFSGDIETSYASRLAVATDNSVYQALPQAVLLPRQQQDVELLTRLAS